MTSVQPELPHFTESNHAIVSRVMDTLSDPDLLAVCGFAAIGLLLTVALARFFPISEVANLIALAD